MHDKLNIYAIGSYLKSDGFRENNNTHRTNILLNTHYYFSEKVNLQVLLRSTKMKAFIPSSLDFETFTNSPEKAAENWKNIKGYEEYLTGQFGVSLNVFTKNRAKISVGTFGGFRNADELRPFNFLDESSGFIGWRGYVQKIIEGNNNVVTITTGLEFFREKYNWSTYSNTANELLSDNIEKRQYENLFIQLETGFSEKVFVSAGVNGNLTRFNYTDKFYDNGDQSGKYEYKPVFSPRLGLNYTFSDHFSAFANGSHGFSTPTFEETLLPEGAINDNIKPETGWSFEFGFRSQFNNKVQFSASYYRIYVNNLLVARRTGEDAYIGLNAGKSQHPGLETDVKWNITKPRSYPAISLYGNATFANYHFTDFVDDEIDYSGKNLPGTTKTTCIAMATINPSKNFGFSVWYRHSGKMPVDDANSAYSDQFGVTNFEASYMGRYKKLSVKIKGGIQNIMDIHYASMLAVNAPSFGGNPPRYYYPGNPRNYYVSVLIGIEQY